MIGFLRRRVSRQEQREETQLQLDFARLRALLDCSDKQDRLEAARKRMAEHYKEQEKARGDSQ